MKRSHTPSSPGTISFEGLRQHFDLPVLEMPEPSPTNFNARLLRANPEKIKQGNARQQLRTAYSIYEGQVPFRAWLQGDHVTTPALCFLESFLQTNSWAIKFYLQRVHPLPFDEARGEMLARIRFMYLEVSMRQLLLKHKLKPFKSIIEMTKEDLTMLRIFKVPDVANMDVSVLIQILDQSHTAGEVGLKYIAHRYHKKTDRNARAMLWQLLQEDSFNRFYSILASQVMTVEANTAYLLTMMECLHLIDPADPYWKLSTTREHIADIITFYQRLRNWDDSFIRSHLPDTVMILRKKRPVDFERLHLLWIQHWVHLLARRGVSFPGLMRFLHRYELQAAIAISWSYDEFESVYKRLSTLSASQSNKLVLEQVKISIVDKALLESMAKAKEVRRPFLKRPSRWY
jgi:hypothetical protein